ncbi:sulfotransferase family protein [Lyngbya confervoides]|uniref:Sulfotransferase domain-containing protein n=1 Tax=Lyngbya confervoides BDU141951 TaxID=1574623 RepID=A0ABD4T8Y1_9CYAN|nr:sulfotransferase [Lyngbya confervoides]MCM1984904.1 sulfotransferase domain-containing protein [Lyngbya confervoides BDU141951]
MKKPDFFIAGAPKCGTTALYSYLEKHPEIYIPDTSSTIEATYGGKKELHFFGRDLAFSRPSLEEYLAYYASATQEKRLGESSVFYLYSKTAAQEIKEFCPTARIIIMLRNPVDMIYSWYSQLLFWGDEDVFDLEVALAVEADRQRGQKLPSRHDHPIECFFYREIAQFYDQVKRYLDIFGSEQVQIIIFDDFKKDTATVYRETLKFLDCDATFMPEFEVVNSNKTIRNRSLQTLLKRPPKSAQVVKHLIPVSLRQSIRQYLQGFNIKTESRKSMNPELKQQLQKEFAGEVKRLSGLIGRDLTFWSHELIFEND